MGRLRAWLARPTRAAQDDRDTAETLWIVTWGTLVVAAIGMAAAIAVQPASLQRRLVTLASVIAVTVVVHTLNRRGRATLGSWLLILSLFAVVTARSATSGGIASPVTPFYVIFVLVAGLLLGWRGGAIAAGLALLSGVGLVIADDTGRLPAAEVTFTPWVSLVFLGMFMGLSMVLQSLIGRRLRANLVRLGERLKELQLLHSAARMLQQQRDPHRAMLERLVALLPAAWQYVDVCQARIVYRDVDARSAGWRDSPWTQVARFTTSDGEGRIEVSYREARPAADEGPFLAEERAALDSLAEMLVNHLELRKHQQGLEDLVATRTAELAEQLERQRGLERLRDDLVHMIVHDMRSPLTTLIFNLELMQRHATGEVAEMAREAYATVQGLNGTATSLLDVSRLESGAMPLERTPCDLSVIAREASARLAPIDTGRTILVEAADPVVVPCDRGLVRRVMENLISNAIKHTPSRGRIWVAVAATAGGARVSVRDEGGGVPVEARHRIFEKFGTLSARQDRQYHSVGLGLAFCKLAVEAHGGRIAVDDVQPRGSEFWFELPAL